MRNCAASSAKLFLALLVGIVGSNANALSLDARIGGVFTDSTLSTVAPGATVNAEGDVYNYAMSVGEFIRVDILISNPEEDLIEAIAASLTYQGEDLDYIGANVPGSILQESGFGAPGLNNIGTGVIKANTPNPPGASGDVWVQAIAYGVAGGVSGPGPDTVSLLFEVTGAANSGFADFTLGFTTGDFVSGASATFSSAVVTIMPEPSAMLLIGLGLAGLSIRGRG